MAFDSAHPLFGEDFDRPKPVTPPPKTKPPEPVYTAADLQTARAEALREGHAAGLAEADSATEALARGALLTIAERLDTARAAATDIAEEAAEAVARLLMDTLAAAFPALCAGHAEGELRAIVRAVLPHLHEDPIITVRASPHMTVALTEEIAALEPDLMDRVRLIPTDAVAVGDLRIAWRAGSARRDTAQLWAEIEAVLAPAGLLSQSTSASNSVLMKEIENVE